MEKEKNIIKMAYDLTENSFEAKEDAEKSLRMLRIIYPQILKADSNKAFDFEEMKIDIDVLFDYLTSLAERIDAIKSNANELHERLCFPKEVYPNE